MFSKSNFRGYEGKCSQKVISGGMRENVLRKKFQGV